MHGENVFLDSWLMQRKGLRWPWITRFVSIENDNIIAEARVDLVLIGKEEVGQRLIRTIPSHIDSAMKSLQNGSS